LSQCDSLKVTCLDLVIAREIECAEARHQKLQETETIKMFLLCEFAWRNPVMTEHGERYFFCSDKQRGCETQQPNLFICLTL
jgi:hypothetical protein